MVEFEISEKLRRIDTIRRTGKVIRLAGGVIEATGPEANVGEVCLVQTHSGNASVKAEVIGFRHNTLILMPLQEIDGLGPGATVTNCHDSSTVGVGEALIGRVLNAIGEPIDGLGPIRTVEMRSPGNLAPHPLKRQPVAAPLQTGVRAIDGFLTIGIGQRIGIMAGSGVGKSVLLGMIARQARAEVNVIALVGERGREVREFIERDLGKEGLRKSVVVVATSDEMPLLRKKGALLATTIAEYFREQGKNVVLMMDSLTRVAMAQREIGLAIGEPPTTRGYTPSTFSFLPKLLERAGNSETGSITGIYTVLVEGDDMNDPVGDTARSILDGHIVLSRRLAARAHFPAIEILQSTSRVMPAVVKKEHLQAARKLIELVAVYREAEDLINIGAYAKGSNKLIDRAIQYIDAINALLKQQMDEFTTFAETVAAMSMLSRDEK